MSAVPAKVAVVIVSYQVREQLAHCLASLVASTEPTDVTVVDNGSTDGSADMVADRFPVVHLIRNGANRGFAVACNQGIRDSRCEYILLLNPDTEVGADAVSTLRRTLDTHTKAGAAGPKIFRPDGSLDLAARRRFPTPAVAFYRLSRLDRLIPKRFGHYNLRYLSPDVEQEIDSGTGACLLLRRSALDVIGLLDEAFFMYGEDLDLCYRLKAAGWSVVYDPRATVVHFKGASSRQRSYRMIREFHRSMAIFFDKHYAANTPRALGRLVHAGIVFRCAAQLLLNAMRPQKRVSK